MTMTITKTKINAEQLLNVLAEEKHLPIFNASKPNIKDFILHKVVPYIDYKNKSVNSRLVVGTVRLDMVEHLEKLGYGGILVQITELVEVEEDEADVG